jgi:signal transduction histidine kinase
MSNLYCGISKNAPRFIVLTLIVITSFILSHKIKAQNNQVVQVKAFSENLSPFPNLSLSINKGEFIELNEKGLVFVSLKASDIPIQSIKLKDETLEVASWNLSKGILEVIIRKKSYIDKKIKVVNENGIAQSGIQIQFKGNKEISKQTDNDGIVTIPLALNEDIRSIDQFRIPGYDLQNFENLGTAILTVKKIQPKVVEAQPQIIEKESNANQKDNQTGLMLQQLDTISSMRAFYGLLNKIPRDQIDEDTQSRLDQKFEELLRNFNNKNIAESNDLLDRISDSTMVEEDIDNLLQQARKDNKSLAQSQLLEGKIQMVREKLNIGFENMSEESKTNLLNEIEQLEDILENNKSVFNENLNIYLNIINELKRRFFDLQELESRLTASERERLKERKIYQQRLFIILAVVLVFAFLIILLFYFRTRLKRQKAELIEANKVVKLTNENLENIVLERTFLLNKTFKELDTVLYKASHDLRAPLSSIAGISDLINRETSNKQLTGLLLKTNKRMDKLLKKLSTVSEIHQPGEFEEIDIKAICEDVISSFKKIIEERGINLKVNIEVENSVISIPKLVEVVIYHLLENAFFFSWVDNEKAGEVILNIISQDEKLEISVSDNGIGVEDNLKHKIFDMFYVGTEQSDGNGLGLYIVQKSTELLNGRMKVVTDEKGITKFIVQLPTDGKGSNTLEFLGSLNA